MLGLYSHWDDAGFQWPRFSGGRWHLGCLSLGSTLPFALSCVPHGDVEKRRSDRDTPHCRSEPVEDIVHNLQIRDIIGLVTQSHCKSHFSACVSFIAQEIQGFKSSRDNLHVFLAVSHS